MINTLLYLVGNNILVKLVQINYKVMYKVFSMFGNYYPGQLSCRHLSSGQLSFGQLCSISWSVSVYCFPGCPFSFHFISVLSILSITLFPLFCPLPSFLHLSGFSSPSVCHFQYFLLSVILVMAPLFNIWDPVVNCGIGVGDKCYKQVCGNDIGRIGEDIVRIGLPKW